MRNKSKRITADYCPFILPIIMNFLLCFQLMTTSDGRYDDNEFSDDSGWVEELLERPQSASKTLQAYIEQFDFEGDTVRTPKATRNGCYARTVPGLLSSKPKSASPPGTLKDLVKTSGDMVDNLVNWVRASYTKDPLRKIVPYGTGRTSLSDRVLLITVRDCSRLPETARDCPRLSGKLSY